MTDSVFSPAMSADDIDAFLREHFPAVLRIPARVTEIGPGWLELTLTTDEAALRLGGTVMGPALMTLADTVVYLLLLSQHGAERMAMAVTSSLHIDFLRRPPSGAVLVARAELLRVGKTLAVGSVHIRDGIAADAPLVAHATVTYSVPRS